MNSNALTVSQFPRLENLADSMAPGDSVHFTAPVSSNGTFLKYVDGLHRAQSRKARIIGYVAAGSAAVTALAAAALFSKPLIGEELYKQIMGPAAIGMTFAGLASLGSAIWALGEYVESLYVRRRRTNAHELAKDGSVFATDLTGNLLPAQVSETSVVTILRNVNNYPVRDYWYAVRPSGATVYRAQLGKLQKYVDQAVIVTGQLSSTPLAEDMTANLDLDARLQGNMMGLPLSGRISGQATGPVSAPTRFRLLDPATGRSAAVVVGTYVPNKGAMSPHELRMVSEEFAATYRADPNRLVHALIEAQNLGRAVTVIGRVHPSGQIYAEGITVAGGSEAYLLSVHQTPPLLKSG